MDWFFYRAVLHCLRTQNTLYKIPYSPIHTYSYKHLLCASYLTFTLQQMHWRATCYQYFVQGCLDMNLDDKMITLLDKN